MGGQSDIEISADLIDNVTICEFKKAEELESYYRAADVFVLPTREDIWGLVVNEAMAYGTPVVTTERCGSGLAMIKNGINGFIVPVDDSGCLADRISETIVRSDSMGIAAIQTAKDYTLEYMADKTFEALMDAVR